MNFVKVKDRNRERDKKKEKLLLIRRENGVENDAMRLLLLCCRLECSFYGIFIVFTVVIVVLEDTVKKEFS